MTNLKLVRPTESHIPEIQSYLDECLAHDSHTHGDSGLDKYEDISKWVTFCRLMQDKETAPNQQWVQSHQFILIEDDSPQIIGMINLRPHLNEGYPSEHGGHIGLGVRPTMRRKGYAKSMLNLCLEECRKIGLEKVLLTCDLDNHGSRATIKACGGKFERLAITGAEIDERYWIDLRISQPSHIINHYSNYDEEARFSRRRGLVEFLTTMRYMEEYLPKSAKVLEIGAGTGRYSRTIADMGYQVHAVELVPHNIDMFLQAMKPNQDIKITQGNALDLSALPDNTYDLTLVLGPLYHLYTPEDKHQAIAEALRVTKPDGVIFAAYCQSDPSIISGGFVRNRFNVKEYIQKGLIDPITFATSSRPEDIFELVRIDDINNLMKPFPVERLHLIGSDMFAHYLHDSLDTMDDETFALYLRHHFTICERQDMIGASHHILDIFRKK